MASSDTVRTNSVSTWHVLLQLGFAEDNLQSGLPGLSFDFGDYKLEVTRCLNRWAVPSLVFSGVYITARRLGSIEFELQCEVESKEFAQALLAYCLSSYPPATPPDWLKEGRELQHLLPWEKKKAAYAARPHCWVQRDWAKLALKTLAVQLATVEDDTPVTVRFNGEMISLRCGGNVTLMPAEGETWDDIYTIDAGALRQLPKRLRDQCVGFAVWEGALVIGGHRYHGVEILRPVDAEVSSGLIQKLAVNLFE